MIILIAVLLTLLIYNLQSQDFSVAFASSWPALDRQTLDFFAPPEGGSYFKHETRNSRRSFRDPRKEIPDRIFTEPGPGLTLCDT
jgi:hypothetical protein